MPWWPVFVFETEPKRVSDRLISARKYFVFFVLNSKSFHTMDFSRCCLILLDFGIILMHFDRFVFTLTILITIVITLLLVANAIALLSAFLGAGKLSRPW